MASSKRSREMWYDRWPTAVDRSNQQEYAAWFRTFRWSHYITLTFSRDVSSRQADELLEEYLSELEAHIRAPLSCLIAQERTYSGLGMPPGRVHFHLLVGCAKSVPKEVFSNLWEQPRYGGNRVKGKSAQVLEYDPVISASYYLFKALHDSSWDWRPRRLEMVSRTKPKSYGTSSRTRRSLRRQAERRASVAPVPEPSLRFPALCKDVKTARPLVESLASGLTESATEYLRGFPHVAYDKLRKAIDGLQ